MSDLEAIAVIGVVALVAAAGVTAYEYINQPPTASSEKQNIVNYYTAATSNPITQAGTSAAIISGVQQIAASSGYGNTYDNPAIIYTNQPESFSQMIAQSTANNNSAVINTTSLGVSTYGGNIASSVYNANATGTATGVWAAGTIGNPYNASGGWQGVGYYKGLATESALTQYITDSNTFNQLNA